MLKEVHKMIDYYKTLQIERTATSDEIKKSFRKLAKKYHPDVNPGDKKSEEIFKQINEAYSILSDESKKAEYDNRMFGSNTEESHQNEKSSASSKTYNPKNKMQDFVHTSNAFESFFGFNPNSDSPELKKNSKVKPMKTKDAFEAIFGKNGFKK